TIGCAQPSCIWTILIYRRTSEPSVSSLFHQAQIILNDIVWILKEFSIMKLSILIFLIFSTSFLFAATVEKPPAAPMRDTKDTYFGVTLNDPYRWMENSSNQEFLDWLKAQNSYTRTVLDALHGRQALLDRIHQLD